ncbi:hypothetical protein HanXRQr2_Chr15g0715691 [Helianthus annuus]|uniref:Uncharacterized protein n=1 Tax=Helianthus annuus TaxID=4232 RepID=A0A9K3H408_HELAN|nr:hypothetical protein HanXRQr2_Chr15g0715691 [Helianthus annuus]KAJ0833131.1 hypothetical protein HanPSC8_Chr15g0686761 [Helianthus annuus]
MQLQPWQNTIRMVNMLTRQLLSILIKFKAIFTHCTIRIIGFHQLLTNFNTRKVFNSRFRRRRRAIPIRIILSKLLNQLFQSRTNKVIT